MMNDFLRRRRSCQAFSLVEVTLALGIIGIAVIPAIAMLPVGLNVHRAAINLTVGAQIVQRVTTDIEQADFTSLFGTNPSSPVSKPLAIRYFDDQGDELLSAGIPNANATNRIYDVQTTVTWPATMLGQKSYNMVSVQILIANNPGHAANIFDPTRKLYSTYFIMVARKS